MPPLHDDYLPADPIIPQIPGSRRCQKRMRLPNVTELAPESCGGQFLESLDLCNERSALFADRLRGRNAHPENPFEPGQAPSSKVDRSAVVSG